MLYTRGLLHDPNRSNITKSSLAHQFFSERLNLTVFLVRYPTENSPSCIERDMDEHFHSRVEKLKTT